MEFSSDPELKRDFLREARGLVEALERSALDLERGVAGELPQARRLLHTLKGNAGLAGAARLAAAIHRLEGRLSADAGAGALLLGACDALRAELEAGGDLSDRGEHLERLASGAGAAAAGAAPGGAAAAELHLPAHRVDALIAAAGDLLVQHGQLHRHVAHSDDGVLRLLADRVETLARRLHAEVLRARMVPLAPVLARYERFVRDEAHRTGKRARLEVTADGVELDQVVIDATSQALVHLVRNAVVHGVEAPAERVARGKPEEAVVTLTARARGPAVELGVSDDGAGFDAAAIRRRAGALGLDGATPVEELAFVPGLSTATLDEGAGRGVGLDAVRRAVGALGGEVTVQTRSGAGTRFALHLPASVALQRVLLFVVGEDTFAVPASSVARVVRLGGGSLRWAGAGRVLEDGGELWPVLEPAELLGSTSQARYALVFDGAVRGALPVDALAGHHDLVVQPIAPDIRGAGPAAGAALAPDGRVVLQLDTLALLKPVRGAPRAPAEVRP